jgi:UDPglucose 6-dehydrogenase
MMEISIIGSGYVGTTIAACLADAGHDVTNVDIDDDIVAAINAGESPIQEPGLDDLIAEYGGGLLCATTNYAAVRETDVTFLALPTPSNEDGSINLDIIEAATRSLGDALAPKVEPHVMGVKLTVIPGTTEDTLGPMLAKAGARRSTMTCT